MYKPRIKKLQKLLQSKKLTALWVSFGPNVKYLSGFHMPEDARLLITQKSAYLFTDFRYQNERYPEFQVKIWKGLDTVKEVLKSERLRTLMFEANGTTVAELEHLKKQLKASLKPVQGLVEQLRIIKDAYEIKCIRKAAQITDDAFRSACNFIQPGKTEIEVAWHIESYMRTHGAEAVAFDPIVASGVNGSKPHAQPTNKKIKAGDLVTIDIGARVDGYHSDMTRTVAVRHVPKGLHAIYDHVFRAQGAGLNAVHAGAKASTIDAICRDYIKEQKYGEYFGHATGHGVGLEIHEAPGVNFTSDTKLEAGMVITVEPGIYVPKLGGVRIEDTVVVTKNGYQLLTKSPKVLSVV